MGAYLFNDASSDLKLEETARGIHVYGNVCSIPVYSVRNYNDGGGEGEGRQEGCLSRDYRVCEHSPVENIHRGSLVTTKVIEHRAEGERCKQRLQEALLPFDERYYGCGGAAPAGQRPFRKQIAYAQGRPA